MKEPPSRQESSVHPVSLYGTFKSTGSGAYILCALMDWASAHTEHGAEDLLARGYGGRRTRHVAVRRCLSIVECSCAQIHKLFPFYWYNSVGG